MSAAETNATYNWLSAGERAFPEMLAAIDAAQTSVALETYTYSDGPLGESFREALVRARQRGARVRVLVDALGSVGLPGSFWELLVSAGGEVRQFNPLALRRMSIRNHRKLLVCDGRVAFVGGFNIASEYEGDGVTRGWRDVGLRIEGPLAGQLAASFEEMFARADFRHKRFMRWRKSGAKRSLAFPTEQILVSGPGRGQNPIKGTLRKDLKQARRVQIVVAYFLPTWRLRHDLARVVRRGGTVQLILAGKSDVLVSQLAARSLYRRFLRSGVEIHEYQPQILHSKLVIVDDAVYVGSANLDQRSLQINYELMLRLQDREVVQGAGEVFASHLQHCRQITHDEWRSGRTIWRRIRQRLAYLFLVHIDPYIARWQWRTLPD